jgi:dienelactone hydrolase
VSHAKIGLHHPKEKEPRLTDKYDPFVRGRFPVGVRTIQTLDKVRGRQFPCEVWYPATAQYAGQDLSPKTQDMFTVPMSDKARSQTAVRDASGQSGTYPLIVFSHASGGGRRGATFLCTHLSSHGYVVAALDHSEMVAPELARKAANESDEQRLARWDAVIAARVPDVRFLLDHLFGPSGWESDAKLDPARIGIAGHSFGGWTALASLDVVRNIRAAVALAPGGASKPRPGILPVKLTFNWGRDVPTLYLVAENDTSLPLEGMYEIFERTPGTKRMIILRRADHVHFMDNVEDLHEAFRTMPVTGDLAAIQRDMLPIAELCSGEEAHLFVRGLTLCHMDAILKEQQAAREFWMQDIEAELKKRAIDAAVCK